VKNLIVRIKGWALAVREYFDYRAAAGELYEQNQGLQDAIVLEMQERQRQLYHCHHTLSAVVIQAGGVLVLPGDVMDAAAGNTVDLLHTDDGKGLILRLRVATDMDAAGDDVVQGSGPEGTH
jgi:hypothetical protein